jgi:hypothetical protein
MYVYIYIYIDIHAYIYNQVCSNKSPGVKSGPAPGAYIQVSDFGPSWPSCYICINWGSLIKRNMFWYLICVGFWSNYPINNVCKLQKRIAKIILQQPQRSPSINLFETLNWLPFLDTCKYRKTDKTPPVKTPPLKIL